MPMLQKSLQRDPRSSRARAVERYQGLTRQADEALYRAKRGGRNRVDRLF